MACLTAVLTPPSTCKACREASSTYNAFHSRSPTLAVTGPVEIHAFSMWNSDSKVSLFLTNQINRNLIHLKGEEYVASNFELIA
jgi:hypothetical protein